MKAILVALLAAFSLNVSAAIIGDLILVVPFDGKLVGIYYTKSKLNGNLVEARDQRRISQVPIMDVKTQYNCAAGLANIVTVDGAKFGNGKFFAIQNGTYEGKLAKFFCAAHNQKFNFIK